MTHTYESNDDVMVEMSPLRELEEAGSALELTREELDRARDHHARTVERWKKACAAAVSWIQARDPHTLEPQKQQGMAPQQGMEYGLKQAQR